MLIVNVLVPESANGGMKIDSLVPLQVTDDNPLIVFPDGAADNVLVLVDWSMLHDGDVVNVGTGPVPVLIVNGYAIVLGYPAIHARACLTLLFALFHRNLIFNLN